MKVSPKNSLTRSSLPSKTWKIRGPLEGRTIYMRLQTLFAAQRGLHELLKHFSCQGTLCCLCRHDKHILCTWILSVKVSNARHHRLPLYRARSWVWHMNRRNVSLLVGTSPGDQSLGCKEWEDAMQVRRTCEENNGWTTHLNTQKYQTEWTSFFVPGRLTNADMALCSAIQKNNQAHTRDLTFSLPSEACTRNAQIETKHENAQIYQTKGSTSTKENFVPHVKPHRTRFTKRRSGVDCR